MRRHLAFLVALFTLSPATAMAAEPETATVSAATPKVQWSGQLQNPYLFHNLYNYENTAGQVGSLPCEAPTCDTFTLENALGGVDLLIDLSSAQSTDISARIKDPSGAWTYYDGWSDGSAPTKVRLKKAPKGTYVINVVARIFGSTNPTAVADTADYAGVASLAVPPAAPAPAPVAAAAPEAAPAPAPAPAAQPAPAAAKKPSAKAACQKKAKKIKNKRKRKAALKRCAKKR